MHLCLIRLPSHPSTSSSDAAAVQNDNTAMEMLHALERNEDPELSVLCNWCNFDFSIVNFPFLCSNIPESPAYGVFISQLIRYSRACSGYLDFLLRGKLLTSKLLRQGYKSYKLSNAFRKFYGRHHELIDKYNMSVSHIITDLCL